MSRTDFRLSNDFVTWYARMLVHNDPSFDNFFVLKKLGKNADSIYARFVQFHNSNPEVYDMFRRFAVEIRNAGYRRYSADAIMHRIRWECDLSQTRSMN